MALPCSRRLLPTIVAQILQQLGWDAVHQSVMDVLVDILDRNLTTVCRKVHFFAELDGRTVPVLDDLDMTFRDLGVNLHDLLDYVTEVEPSSLVVEVPQFPISAEKIKSQLGAERNNSATSKVKITKPAEEQRRPETEDGSQGVAPLGTASATTPGTSAADAKPFANESAANKRTRLLPDEAMHSQYEMKSFLVSNSGCFIPVKPGIRASARCGSPSPPKRPVQRSPTLPMYTCETANVIGELELRRTLEPEVRTLHTKHVKKSSKLPKDGLHKMLKHGAKKSKKPSHAGPSGMSKLPIKSLKSEKTRLSKSKSSDKKSSANPPAPLTYPGDLTQVCEDAPVDRELQNSRIRSYEDSINTVVLYSSQDGVRFSPNELHMVPSVAGPSVLDGKTSPVDDFYLDLGSPPPPASQLFDHHGTAERDAHINSTIDDVIKASSLDDNLKMSPEPGEPENEMEPKQSAVEDIFDVSSVPSPKIPTTWQTVEEEEIVEEPIAATIDDFSIPNVLGEHGSPAKKPKKLKTKAPFKDGFDKSSKKSDFQNKKTSRNLTEQLVFDDSSRGNWSGEDWERKSKDPLGLSTVLPEASAFPKCVDNWNKNSKHQTSELPNVDSIYGRDNFERNFAQTTSDSDMPRLSVGTDDVHKKRKHRRGNDDAVTTERKKSKHASNRSTFSSTPEPQRATRGHSDEVFPGPQDSQQSLICEWPKVRLENVGVFDEKKPSKKRPFPYSPTPPSLHLSPEPLPVSSKSLLPPSPSPPPPLPPVSDHLDTNSLPPLKRIKIVSSAGVVNQFEIKEPPQSSSVVEKDYKPDRKEKKKAKKSKDRERSRDRKDRNLNYEPRDHTPTTFSNDWENQVSNKMDSKPGKISSGGKHHHRAVVPSPGEDLGWRSNEDQFSISRGSTGQLPDFRFLETSASSIEHRWKESARSLREEEEEELDRERSRTHKKKDRSKSRDEGKSGRKEEKLREQSEKSAEKSEHKKKKSERRRETELSSETVPLQLPSIPKLTLKFGNSSVGTPSFSRTTEPSVQPVARILPDPPTNPPIKLRFKTGFSSMPSAVSSPSLAGQLPYYDNTAGPSAKFPPQPRVNQSLLEVPTFSPSPESISIPSPNDTSDSELSVGGRERVPIPLSLPIPVVPLHRVPVYTSSSESSRSPSPHRPKEDDGWQASFSAPSRRSGAPQPVDLAVVNTPKSETSSRVLKSAASSKGSSQKPKSSARVASSPQKVFPSHVKGLPPSKIMPLAIPTLPLLPAPKASQLGAKSGSSKSKKRVTTETVSKVVNEDGVVTTWICPACLLEDKGEEPMIGCDGCDDWYHWRCVGVIVEPPKEIPWYCQRCQIKSKTPLKATSSGRGKGKKSKRK